ncbi:DUF6318 family protein [Arthrobacter sp. TMN-49]
MLLSGLLVLSACSPSPPGTSATTPPGRTSGATETSAITPTSTTPAPSPVAAYKPATANGAAQNVPVPVLPAKAKEFSKEGLIAFAEYWYSTLGYAFETGDPAPMMAISDPGCRTCEAMKKTVVPWNSEGRWIVGGQMHVLSAVSSFEMVDDGTFQVIAMVRQQNVMFYRADESLAEDKGVKTSVADILVGRYEDGRWTAETVEHVSGSEP